MRGRMAKPREIVHAATFVVDGGLTAADVTPE
jgi:hypothetical protein